MSAKPDSVAETIGIRASRSQRWRPYVASLLSVIFAGQMGACEGSLGDFPSDHAQEEAWLEAETKGEAPAQARSLAAPTENSATALPSDYASLPAPVQADAATLVRAPSATPISTLAASFTTNFQSKLAAGTIAGLVPAPAMVGSLPGKVEVSAHGVATYDLPLSVPVGVNGHAPTLSLSYQTGGGDGALGVGWSLSMPPVVRKCEPWGTVNVPNNSGGIEFADKTLVNAKQRMCYGDAPLVRTSLPLNLDRDRLAPGRYRTVPDQFVEVERPSDRDEWIVREKSGLTHRYVKQNEWWARQSTRDTFGNEIVYNYGSECGEHLSSVTDVDSKNLVEQSSMPCRIDYVRTNDDSCRDVDNKGLCFRRHVRFVYESHPFARIVYGAGGPSLMDRLLRRVLLSGDGHAGEGYSYELSYGNSVATGRPVLKSVTMCTESGACVPPTAFTYADYAATDTPFSTGPSVKLSEAPFNIQKPSVCGAIMPRLEGRKGIPGDVSAVDLNADGRDDLVWRNAVGTLGGSVYDGQTVYSLAKADGTLEAPKTFSGASLLKCDRLLPWQGERGSDGRLLCLAEDNNLYALGLDGATDLSQRKVNDRFFDPRPLIPGDFDGDGKLDALGCLPATPADLDLVASEYWQRWVDDYHDDPENSSLGRWGVIFGTRSGEARRELLTQRPCDREAKVRTVLRGRMPKTSATVQETWHKGELYGAIAQVAVVEHSDPQDISRPGALEITTGVDSYSICDSSPIPGPRCSLGEFSSDFWELEPEERDLHPTLKHGIMDGTRVVDINGDGTIDFPGFSYAFDDDPVLVAGLSLYPDRPVWYLARGSSDAQDRPFVTFQSGAQIFHEAHWYDWNEDGLQDQLVPWPISTAAASKWAWNVFLGGVVNDGGVVHRRRDALDTVGGRAYVQPSLGGALAYQFGYPRIVDCGDSRFCCGDPVALDGHELGVDGTAYFVPGDFDGDGRQDLASVKTTGSSAMWATVRLRRPLRAASADSRPVPDALITVVDGVGSTTKIDYLPMIDARVLTNPSRINVGYSSSQGECGADCRERVENDGRTVVWRLTQPTHSALNSQQQVTSYRYGRFLHDVPTNSPLGFDTVLKTVDVPGAKVLEQIEYVRAPDGPLSDLAVAALTKRTSGLLPRLKTRFSLDLSPTRPTRVHVETEEAQYGAIRTVNAGLFFAPYFTPPTQIVKEVGEFTYTSTPDFLSVRTAWQAVPAANRAVTTERGLDGTYDEFGNRLNWITIGPDGTTTAEQSLFVREAAALSVWRVGLPRASVVTVRHTPRWNPLETPADRSIDNNKVWSYCDTEPCTSVDYRRAKPRWEIVASGDTLHEIQTRRTYDNWGNPIEVMTRGRSGMAGSTYTPEQIVTDAYDPEHLFVTSSTNNLGHYWRRDSDWRFGQPTYELDANGREQGWGYDILRRLVYHVDKGGFDSPTAAGITKTFNYQPGATVAGVAAPVKLREEASDGSWKETFVDPFGRKVAETYPAFEGHKRVQYYRYDSLGNLEQESLPSDAALSSTGNGVPYVVRDMGVGGRVWSESRPNGLTLAYSYGRNATGLWSSVAEQGVFKELKQNDKADRLLTTIDGVKNQRCFSYDVRGLLHATWSLKKGVGDLVNTVAACTQATQVFGGTTLVVNDAYGLTTEVRDPEAGNITFVKDAFGRNVRETDAKGNTTSFKYDALGRMIEKTTPEGTHTYVWDLYMTGSLSRVSGPWGTRQTVHDNLGRLRSEIYQYAPDFEPAWTIYKYNQTTTGKLETVILPAAGDVSDAPKPSLNFKYNSVGQLAAVLNSDKTRAYWHRLSTDVFGQTRQESYGPAVSNPLGGEITTTRETDPYTGRLTRLTSYGFDELGRHALIQDFTIQRNLNGQAWARSDGIVQQQEIYTYDAANRLRQADIGNFVSPSTVVKYDYDPIGNLTVKSDAGTLVYDSATSPKRLTKAGTVTYTYDANGNVTKRGGSTYTWNKEDNLVAITTATQSLAMTYDDQGQMIRRVSSDGSTWEYYGADYTREAFDNPSEGAGIKHRYRVRVGGDAVVELMYFPKWPGDSPRPDSVEYILSDDRQSPNVVVQAGWGVEQRMSWDVYGDKRSPLQWGNLNSTFVNQTDTTVGFTGHRELEDDGLIWMAARHYDPKIGRFVKPDSVIGKPSSTQGWGRYVYVENDPVNATDPSGHMGMSMNSAATAAAIAYVDGFNGGVMVLPQKLATVAKEGETPKGSDPLESFWHMMQSLFTSSDDGTSEESEADKQGGQERHSMLDFTESMTDAKGAGAAPATPETIEKAEQAGTDRGHLLERGEEAWTETVIYEIATLGVGAVVGIMVRAGKAAANATRVLKATEETAEQTAKIAAKTQAASGPQFEILDGVRRAKAAELAGKGSIRASVMHEGRIIATRDVPLQQLLSPNKSYIDVTSSPAAMNRWKSVWEGTQAGQISTPIQVQTGTRGIPLSDVMFQ